MLYFVLAIVSQIIILHVCNKINFLVVRSNGVEREAYFVLVIILLLLSGMLWYTYLSGIMDLIILYALILVVSLLSAIIISRGGAKRGR